MASIIAPTGDEGIAVTSQAAARLLERGDGDAALLYLALLRRKGTVQPRALAGELRWDRQRIEQAEAALREMKLILPAAPPPEPAAERPAYRQEEVAAQLEEHPEFRELTEAVEKRLDKKLTTPDVEVLLGLYDYLGLPADVVYLLVCHCAQRTERRFGPGRRPGMKQIEREGYAWARMGIDTQSAAAAHLKRWAERQASMPGYMRALQLGERIPVASEEKYLTAWQEMGFPPETVALAYDKTVLKCQKLEWKYLNGILKNWHEKNLHTVEEVEAGDRPPARREGKTAPPPSGGNVEWMKRYIQRREEG